MDSNQLSETLGCLVTATVLLSSPQASPQRALVVACSSSVPEIGVVALASFIRTGSTYICTSFNFVACSEHLHVQAQTPQQDQPITLAFSDTSHSFTCHVPSQHATACPALIHEANRLKQVAETENTEENTIKAWAAMLRVSDHHSITQAATRHSVKASQLNMLLHRRRSEFVTHESLKIFLGTWNVNGWLLGPEDDLHPWLIQSAEADLIVLGFQELDLSAQALVRYTPDRAQAYQAHLKNALASYGEFQVVTSNQLVGLFIVVFARKGLAQEHISRVAVDSVATGPMGFANKGAVSVSLR